MRLQEYDKGQLIEEVVYPSSLPPRLCSDYVRTEFRQDDGFGGETASVR